MGSAQEARTDLADDSFRSALFLGFFSIPFTVVLSWEPISDGVFVIGGSISGTPVLVAGLFVGYRYSRRGASSRRAGMVAGLVGSSVTVTIFLASTAETISAACETHRSTAGQ